MNPLWLLLIIPLSMTLGAFCMALAAVNKRNQSKYDDDQMRLRDTV